MEEFVKKIEDLYKRCLNRNIITYTGFLTPAEKQHVISKFGNVNLLFDGGVEVAERVRAFFIPDYIEEIEIENFIVAFKASFSFKKLSHRDFLGALLSLGVERRCIGDIYVFEKEAYFFITKDISEYIKVNLTKVSNIGVKVIEIPIGDVKILTPSFKELSFTIASLRLDNIISGAIKESREKGNYLIKNGNVLLNYSICDEPSQKIKEGDVFSIKGHGKFILAEVGGVSRSGKYFVKVKKYI